MNRRTFTWKRISPISKDRLTHVQLLFTWNLSPLQSSKFSFEYLLLPPRSALEDVSLRLTPRAALQPPYPPTHQSIVFTLMVKYKRPASASSIFRARSFGRWVVTHSLADSNFHGHRPAVRMIQHLLWVLGERVLWRFNLTFGASRIAIRAYPVWPTNNHHPTAGFAGTTPGSYSFKVWE